MTSEGLTYKLDYGHVITTERGQTFTNTSKHPVWVRLGPDGYIASITPENKQPNPKRHLRRVK